MAYWEFLIQREGDRGWRTIKTGNLQLTEGRYRIVAKSDRYDTPIKTRFTHQTLGTTVPQRRSQSRTQTTNAKGLLVIIPFTNLHSGMWQFVCSGETTDVESWHQILKLRVLPRTSTPLQPINDTHQPNSSLDTPQMASAAIERPAIATDRNEDLNPPTQPLVPISLVGEQENWVDGLDRLLEQLERDSLKAPSPPATHRTLPGVIQLTPIASSPSQLISLNRSTFSGIVPGHRFTINGSCNLQRLSLKPIQRVKIEKLSICLRHPQTSEIVTAIERPLPADLETFAFSSQIELPTEPKISLLLGEVSLYDKHNIQIGSSGFTVTLNLNPLHESEQSLLRMFERGEDTSSQLERLTQELHLESSRIGSKGFDRRAAGSPSPSQPLHPTIPLTYKPETFLDRRSDIFPVEPARDGIKASVEPSSSHLQPTHPHPPHPVTHDITGDLEIDFPLLTGELAAQHRHSYQRNYKNLEIVIDD